MKIWGKIIDDAAAEESGRRGAEVHHGVPKVPQTEGNLTLRALLVDFGEYPIWWQQAHFSRGLRPPGDYEVPIVR